MERLTQLKLIQKHVDISPESRFILLFVTPLTAIVPGSLQAIFFTSLKAQPPTHKHKRLAPAQHSAIAISPASV